MSKAGENNFKGINSQAWAAMSLFLQYLHEPKFSSIQLEGEKFEDFTLIFQDGKKIICESKDRAEKFSYPHLKQLLENISNKKVLGKNDEILVVCRKVNTELATETQYLEYFEKVKDKFIKKGYTEELLEMLPHVKFWTVPASFNEEIIYALFSELINFWLPQKDLEKFVDNLLIQKIYKGSARGLSYGRTDILDEINGLAKEVKKNSIYREDLIKREKQFNELDEALNKPKHLLWEVPKELSAFSTDYERLVFAKDRLLKKQNELVLKNWSPLWQLNKIRYFTFGIFDIFENNLHLEENRKYVLQYIKKYVKDTRKFYQPDFFTADVVKMVSKIVDSERGKEYLEDSFEILKDTIVHRKRDLFYVKSANSSHDQWEEQQVCQLLHKIYGLADKKLGQEIFKFIVSVFNITENDGEFDWHVPAEVYSIARNWLEEDFQNRFSKLIKIISDQYSKAYNKFGGRLKFAGWEYAGGGTSFGPGGYHIGDRHFIGNILVPAIKKYHENNKKQGWQFIREYCVTPEKKVTASRPDFLNRAILDIVLDRYKDANEKVSDEAFEILKEFILSKRGIPHKSELIHQRLTGVNVSNDKKWKLLELTINKYGVPVDPFVEQLVTNLAKENDARARGVWKKWLSNPDYYKGLRFDVSFIANLKNLMQADWELAADLFEAFIKSDHFTSAKYDSFEAFEFANFLHRILKEHYERGIKIIRELERAKSLSKGQQILYCFSLFARGDEKDNEEFLLRVYVEVIDPFLKRMGNDINNIIKRISVGGYREAFVQFASELAEKKRIKEALRIIKIFVNDPDPYLPGEDPDDSENKYNEHKRIETEGEEPHAITSVRGWCAWALMKCSVLEGRAHIQEIIQLAQRLIEDKNYYVIHMGTFALSQLANVRLTVLPNKRDVLFLDNDKRVALEMAKDIENTSFELLERFSKWPDKVKKALAKSVLHIFNSIRALNKEAILKLLNILKELPSEVFDDGAPLFLYYSELRAGGYGDWKFSAPGLYDDLIITKKEADKFKRITLDVIKRLQSKNPDDAFRFASSAEHLMREGWANIDEKDRYTKIAFEYFNLVTNIYGHNIFSLVYRVIEDKLKADDKYIKRWYELLIKCFGVEEKFYEAQVKAGKQQDVYWYPSLYHSRILELVHEKLGEAEFLNVAEIFFLKFPKEIELHESQALVEIIEKLAMAKNITARKIITSLRHRNPSKYWELKPKKANV